MSKLPIDDILPDIQNTVAFSSSLVVQAPPGAGKTSRVPLALLDLPCLKNGRIVMMEPRRLAAVNAARWMAATIGEEIGQTIGYTIRFDRKISANTRIEVVTEGILTRRIQHDPGLTGISAVIFDEFHERSLDADMAMAFCLDARQGLREDLRIIVMSATIEGEDVARLLGNAPVLTSSGKSFPVDVRYLGKEAEGEMVKSVADLVRTAIRDSEGDILVFLPGGREIRRCRALLEETVWNAAAPLILPLYGDLPFAEQERAMIAGERRKVVLATNIAETSLTIEGVRVVVDSGYARELRFDPATGMNRLVTVRVSAASAAQRAGRSGRLGPGVCYRLWTEHVQRTLIPYSQPEILTADLTSLVLELAVWGVKSADSLQWLDPPPDAAMSEGRSLLTNLGALDPSGLPTRHGASMARLPLHPRLAHMLIMAREWHMGDVACDIAGLLSERDIIKSGPLPGNVCKSESDIVDRLDLLEGWRSGREVPREVDPGACRSVDRVAGYLKKLLKVSERTSGVPPLMAGRLLALAYPDRIARQREPGSDRYLLANGRGGILSPRSAVRDREFLVAAVVEGGERSDGIIHLASGIDLDDMRRDCAAGIRKVRVVSWDHSAGRATAREEERLGALVLSTIPVRPADTERQEAFIAGMRAGALKSLQWNPEALQFLARARFAGRHCPVGEWPELDEASLERNMPVWLGPFISGVRLQAGLSGVDLMVPLKALFSHDQLRRINEGAPAGLEVPSGSRISLDYAGADAPALEVKLQELFGLADTPRVAFGKVPVVLHLLSPARRPVQITTDLSGFWNGAYREVRKELKGRYPKHPWPEDPWSAIPTRHTKKTGAKNQALGSGR